MAYEPSSKIPRSRSVTIFTAAAFALVLGGMVWAIAVLAGTAAANPLILHFDDLAGITHVGGTANLAILGVFGMVVVAVNTAIARELDGRNRIWSRFLTALTLVFAVLLFIAFAAIMNVNV